ncbi:MAG TPA: P-type conjugative transfer ATPase TrbB [Candidatus Competibacteraceae bacterium]|nr:P-type conjugative transfer ATPase TrbB [Candidatus Competibacteraceae bacterium]
MSLLDLATEVSRRHAEKLRRELGPVVRHALQDPRVVEVLLNPDGKLWVDILGEGLRDTGETLSPAQAENLLGTVAALLGTVITAERPLLEGELPLDGSRFQGVLPPVVAQPVFAIRKRAVQVFTLDDYVTGGLLTAAHAGAIREAVAQRRNLLVVGGTSSGKTTLANAILAVIADQAGARERLVLLEDTVELQCTAPNTVALRTTETIDLTRLLRATLRLRPDRIIVGEVRGGEALALLKAWNTGHSGGLATVHANSAEAGLLRLEQLIQEAGVSPQPALIAEAVHLIVHLVKEDGWRFVKAVTEVHGWESGGGYRLKSL